MGDVNLHFILPSFLKKKILGFPEVSPDLFILLPLPRNIMEFRHECRHCGRSK
jgi:hypothetical protein